MGKGKTLTTIAAIGAAIAGVVFFWRKRHHDEPATGRPAPGGFPPAADIPADAPPTDATA